MLDTTRNNPNGFADKHPINISLNLSTVPKFTRQTSPHLLKVLLSPEQISLLEQNFKTLN